ncbi:MAG: tetratricopeptide repeat protein [Desulfocapsa sp.]|nr:tetratricopeptide repeat protein [Desulfocapsa sp.]
MPRQHPKTQKRVQGNKKEHPPPNPKKKATLFLISNSLPTWVQLFFLAATIVLTYGHTLDVPFYFDDFQGIIRNTAIHNLFDLKKIWDFIPYRVVGNVTFAINYHWHQLHVAGYHVINITIHFLSCCSVFGLSRGLLSTPVVRNRITRENEYWLPLLAALIFALHPLHTQAVTYIIQRFASLAALLYIGSLACYVQARIYKFSTGKVIWMLSVIILAGLAFFTKQNTATLPISILLIEIIFFSAKLERVLLLFVTAFLFLLATYCLLFFVFDYAPFSLEAMQTMTRETKVISRGDYLATQTRVVWYYLGLFFWPAGLHLDYSFPLSGGFFDRAVLLSGLGHGLLIGFACFCIRRYPFVAFGILFYYIAHLVESSFIPIRDVLFEHRTYLPDAGLCIVAAWGVTTLIGRSEKIKIPLVPGVLMLLCTLGVATWQRNNVWRYPIPFWKDCIEKEANYSRPLNNLGRILFEQKQYEAALQYFTRSLALEPYHPRVHHNLGLIYAELGATDRAIQHMSLAVQLDKKFGEAHYNLGTLYDETGNLQKAMHHYQEALRLKYEFAGLHNNLGSLYAAQGQLGKAVKAYKRALQIDPQFTEAYNNLGLALSWQGEFEKAITYFEEALQQDGNNAKTYSNIGMVYARQERFDMAVSALERALELDPMLAETSNNLGVVYYRQGKIEKAMVSFEQAVRINPDYREARNNLERAREELAQ